MYSQGAIIIALIAGTVIIEGLDVKLKPPGENQIKARGVSTVFTCQIDSYEDDPKDNRSITEKIKFQWIDGEGKEIRAGAGRRYVEDVGDGIKLYLTTIEMSDAGLFTCRASLKSDSSQSAEKAIRLELFEAISFKDTNLTQHQAINTEALIKCVATGNPKPVVSWKYKGKRVPKSGRYNQTSEGLVIRNITRADDGEYTCRAEVDDDGRYDERVIQVAVHIPPKMVTQLQQTESVEGRSVTLSCKAEALPSPNYKFFKDGVEVVSDQGRMLVDNVTGKLTLYPLNRTDQGNYECRASNDVGQDSSKAPLRVFIPARIDRFHNETLSEGKRLTLTCQSSGDPDPNVIITRAGRNYTINDQNNEMGYQLSATKPGELILTVERVRVEDCGEYTCTTVNKVGHQRSEATVTVHYKPRFSRDNDLLVYSWAGTQHNLTCQSYGLPRPTLSWQRKGVTLQSNDTYRIFEWNDENSTTISLEVKVTTLDIPWIFGTGYMCEAVNSLGSERQDFELKRAVNPDVPRGVKLIERFADSVTIEVEEPLDTGGIPVIGYSVSYTEQVGRSSDIAMNTEKHSDVKADDDNVDDEETASNKIKIDRKAGNAVHVIVDKEDNEPYDEIGNKKQMTKAKSLVFNGNRTRISELKPETSYLLKVKARNQVGPGPDLKHTVTTDKQSAPGRIIIKPTSQGMDGRRFDLKWELHNRGGLPIREYEFNYTKVQRPNEVSKDAVWTRKVVPVGSADFENYELSELVPHSTYVVQMRARNELGWSPSSERFTFTTVEAAAVGNSAASHGQTISETISLLTTVLITAFISRSPNDL